VPLTIHAPELDGGVAWLNTSRPLSLRELRGNVVVLDFWTYCCINCMHVLPVLRAVEERHAGEPFVVIGVHSGKFDTERDPAHIEAAVRRYEITHPVVVDHEMSIWSRYGVRSWPTLVVLRPDGTIAAVAPGEPDLEVFDRFITKQLDEARQKGTLAARPPEIHVPAAAAEGALLYPGKVSLLPDGRLVVSDSGHHRVLVTARDGKVEMTIGSGKRGLADGPPHEAAFDDPQGSCFFGGAVFVADAKNHAIRRVDLDTGEVVTVAGTGELALTMPATRVSAIGAALRSPWDLCAVDGAIFVAMAGSHQIFRFHPDRGEIEPYAGTGVEALVDGPIADSAWAQPSGLAARGRTLYVADSETSAIRAVDLDRSVVTTLVGEGLFDFGDADGPAPTARLQHALGVAVHTDGTVLVADTYNGKIKRIRERAGDLVVDTQIVGLSEPGSIAVASDGSWIVADTNAHRVVRIERGAITPIAITGAPAPERGAVGPRAKKDGGHVGTVGWFEALLTLPDGKGIAPGEGTIDLVLHAEPGAEIAAQAPIRAAIEVSRRSDLLLVPEPRLSLSAGGGPAEPIAIPVRVEALPAPQIEAELVVTLDYVACDAREHTACVPGRIHVRVPVRLLREGGQDRLSFRVPLPALEI
jgi:sugar lactone lactonase YvrE